MNYLSTVKDMKKAGWKLDALTSRNNSTGSFELVATSRKSGADPVECVRNFVNFFIADGFERKAEHLLCDSTLA